jgi:hypothetical protein
MDGNPIDPNLEQVAQFIVELKWSSDYYGSSSPWPVGLAQVKIVIEGVATSTEAIEKAKSILASVRQDEPRETKVELKTASRRIPKKIGNGSTFNEAQR